MVRTKREIWTFRPDDISKSLVSKAANDLARKIRRRGQSIDRRGLRSEIINEALRNHLASFAGKRESNVSEPIQHLRD